MKKNNTTFLIEESISLQKINSATINKDGTFVVYELSIADWQTDKYVKELWLYDVLRDKHEQIICKDESYISDAKWSPDGNKLALLMKKDEKPQIYIIEIENRKKIQVSSHDKGVHSYIWSYDSKGFYYLAQSPNCQEKDDRDKKYGKFEYVDQENSNNALFYIDLKKALSFNNQRHELPDDLLEKSESEYYPASLLVDQKGFYITSMTASNDGKKLALLVAPSPSVEDYDANLKLYIYDIKSAKYDELKIDNFKGNVLFSPDSKKVCFSTRTSWLDNNKIATYDFESGEISNIEIAIDEFVFVSQWYEHGMVIGHLDKTGYKYSVLNKNKLDCFEAGLDEVSFYQSLEFDYKGNNVVYIKKTKDSLAELYINGRRIIDYSKVLKGRTYANKEMISWKNNDGIEIEGVLSKPQNFDINKKYPLLVIIHGGPVGISLPYVVSDWLYPIESFVERGFITLEPNYRGGAGYGEKFRASNFRNLGLGDYDDVISGVDYLIEQGFADKEKVGVMGWSQGGYISAFCATYSDRFKAVSVGAGISDWTTYYYNTDIPKFTKVYLGDVPFKDQQIYEKTSPITYVNNAKTPVLIQHGSADARVPVANAYELYRALKELSLEPKLVIYDGMRHVPHTLGFTRAIRLQNLNWFCHHILGDELVEIC